MHLLLIWDVDGATYIGIGEVSSGDEVVGRTYGIGQLECDG